jgi:hypothetical protein
VVYFFQQSGLLEDCWSIRLVSKLYVTHPYVDSCQGMKLLPRDGWQLSLLQKWRSIRLCWPQLSTWRRILGAESSVEWHHRADKSKHVDCVQPSLKMNSSVTIFSFLDFSEGGGGRSDLRLHCVAAWPRRLIPAVKRTLDTAL